MTDFIRYEIKNTEPLRIADDSTSQSGQTNTLKFIPGSTIRGYVISKLAASPEFDAIKKQLFSSGVRFMNCFPKAGDWELLPPLKGFYEYKNPPGEDGKKKIENVVLEGHFTDGMKRASLGSACFPEGDCIHYYHVDTGSDMKIKIRVKGKDKQNVFRNEYMTSGKTFVGYIAVDEKYKDIKENLFEALDEWMLLGNARSSGMGKCRLIKKEWISESDYIKVRGIPKQAISGNLYMVLLSHTVMRDECGQYCGLNITELEQKLGVSNLEIAFCSTSTVNVRGYNRTLRLKLPSLTMYEQGSVFHLTFTGTATAESLKAIVEQGR